MKKFMKKLFDFILIITCALHFGTTAVSAQERAKSREVIVIEFKVPNNDFVKREVSINKTSKIHAGVGGTSGIYIGAGCGGCSRAEIEKLNEEYKEDQRKRAYHYSAESWRINKNESKLSFVISINGESCKTQKTLSVYRNRQTKILLDCGINLTAYYGFESEKAN